MATKNYIDLTGLTRYDELIKNYIDTADSGKVDKVDEGSGNIAQISSEGGIEDSGFKIDIDPESITGYQLLYFNPPSSSIEVCDVDYQDVSNALAVVDSLASVATSGAALDVSYSNSTSGLSSTNVQGAIDELAEASQGGVASKTVYITETSGSSSDAFSKRYGIYQGATGSSASPVAGEKLADIDIPKDMVVEDGSVVDIHYENGHLYDGRTDVTEIIKGEGGTATADDAGKYIKLEIANATSSVLYIKATDLVDIYTTEQNARQIQLTIDSSNVISAAIVAGSVGTTELADSAVTTAKINNSAVTTAKIADDAVTADKVAIAAHTEAQTAGSDGLAISVTTTDGQVSAVSGSIASNTYDAYGAAATAKSDVIGTSGDAASANTIYGAKAYADTATRSAVTALDANVSQTAGADGLALALTEVDGVVTAISGSIAANTYEPYGTVATEIAKLDATATQTASTDGLALSVTEVDGKITAISGSIAANTYDAYGAASTVQTTLIGASTDTGSANTIYGAKAYADAATAAVPTASIEALFD